jgi:hypothetical protein
MISNAQRKRMVQIAAYLVSKAPQIHYAEVRPMTTRTIATFAALQNILDHGGHITMDCSESVTLICHLVGLRDPNGLNYDGAGYTGDMYDHLPHYENVADGHPGALMIFGVDPTDHVCMVMQRNGENPWLFSHGSESGPLHIPFDEERQAHVGQAVTMLDVSSL